MFQNSSTLPENQSEVRAPEPVKILGKKLLHPYEPQKVEVLDENKIFTFRRETIERPGDRSLSDYYTLHSGPWVNIIGVTPDDELILVRQFRVGTRQHSLEIPGGVIERDEDPADAAVRELAEETGFRGDAPIALGVMEPNPALFNNYTYTFLVENCQLADDQQLDLGEEVQVELYRISDLPKLVTSGAIKHALVLAGFCFYQTYLAEK
jgi:8-oxo-dGTP pyrophosphatase MutT (NUDIX family)